MTAILEYSELVTKKYRRTQELLNRIKSSQTIEQLNSTVRLNYGFIESNPELWYSISRTRLRIARVEKEKKNSYNLTDKN